MTTRGFQEQASEEYSFYRKALVKRLGEYCSFCEVPLGASLAVEHIISKSTVPTLEADWNNFILACTNCNSSKSNKVNLGNLRLYYFPCDTTIDSFSKFTYYLDGGGKARVKPAADGDQRAIETIALVALDRERTNDPKVSDRRIANRTGAWNAARELAGLLDGYYTGPAPAPDSEAAKLLKEQIKAAAIAWGFWSVWMTLFLEKRFGDPATKNNLLCELFVKTFPGTNYTLGANCVRVVDGGLPR
jgi:hypothetical protein